MEKSILKRNAIELDLSLSGSYGGKSYRKPMTVKGYESMSPEFWSETQSKTLRGAAGESFLQWTKVWQREIKCLYIYVDYTLFKS